MAIESPPPATNVLPTSRLVHRPGTTAHPVSDNLLVTRMYCSAGHEAAPWPDDGNTGKHALRVGTLPCTS